MKQAKSLKDIPAAFEPDALTNADLDEFYFDGTMPVRTGDPYASPIQDLFDACTQPKQSNAHLLLGHRGCGKSTELSVLKRKLEEAGHPVSIIKCSIEADVMAVTYWDLLLLLGKHLVELAGEANVTIDDDLIKGMNDFFAEIEIVDQLSDQYLAGLSGGVEVGLPALPFLTKLFAGISAQVKYGSEKRTIIRQRVERSSAEWFGYIEFIADRITHRNGGRQPVIIFEDLDKIKTEQAWDIFSNPMSSMPFPVIYTFPINLSYDARFRTLGSAFNSFEILPMIEIRDRDGVVKSEGFEAIRKIVGIRASSDLFAEETLYHLITKTGGVLRDLFKCIISAASRADRRGSSVIEMEDVQRATDELRSELTRIVSAPYNDLLVNISKQKQFRDQIEDSEKMLLMMEGLIVLEYNGRRWCDVHPLIEDFLRDIGVLE